MASIFCQVASVLWLGIALVISNSARSLAQELEFQSFDLTRTVFGQVVFLERSTLAAPRSGVISEIVPSNGHAFAEGDTLFALDCEIESAQTEVYEAALARAQIQLQVQEELRDFSVSTELEVSLAAAELEKAEAELRVYEETVRQCTVSAPYNGLVFEKLFFDYEYVREGEAVLKIGNPASLAFVFLAPADWISDLRIGRLVDVHFTNIDLTVIMELTEVAPTIEAIGQTVTVTAEPDDVSMARLIPGMVGTVSLARE